MSGNDDAWLTKHVALLFSAGGAAIVVARLLAVSGYNSQTAYYVLSSQGTANVVLGTLIPIFTLLPSCCWPLRYRSQICGDMNLRTDPRSASCRDGWHMGD